MGNFLRHLFLPHHTNNFRAKLLHLDFFALYVVVFFLFSISFRTIHRINPDILGFATDIHIEQLLTLINQKRTEAGLASLRLDERLSQAAGGKARDMFTKNYWAHTAPDGMTPWDFINGAGYSYSVAGENLAKNFANSQGVVDAWMNSSTHRENILRSQYQDVGFAIVDGVLNGEETTLVVQMFGLPVAQIATNIVETAQPETAVPPLSIPVGGVQAKESKVAPTPVPTPVASIYPAEVVVQPTTAVITTPLAAVSKQPFIDIPTLAKRLTLGLSTILMLVLVVDMIYIWHKKIVRVGGKPVAHLLFLFIVSGIIWFMSFGSII